MPASHTARERIVAEARNLFSENGYEATSVADILQAAGANSGSLYHHFGSKQDVLLEVLRTYRAGIHSMLLNPAWEGIKDPIERVFALLERYRGLLQQTDCLYGCPIGSLALELRKPDRAIREALAGNFSAWTSAIEGCLDEAQDRLPTDLDRAALAAFVLTTMEGGVMLARTHRDLKWFDVVVGQLHRYFAVLQRAASGGVG